MEDLSIGIDLGGTKIGIGFVDAKGQLVTKKIIPTPVEEGAEEIIRSIINVVTEMQKDNHRPISNIGVGVAGQIDKVNGVVRFAPNLHWHNIPLKHLMNSGLHLPVYVTNDVRAATWTEWHYGSGKGAKNLVCLFLGTGIGGGVVADGKILEGENNSLGEFGHMVIDINGPVCNCGNWGCFEALAGGHGFAKIAQKAVLEDHKDGTFIRNLAEQRNSEINAKIVIEAFREGDDLAAWLVTQLIQAIVAGSVSIVNTLNPERLILGGGLVEGLPEIISEVNLGVRQRALPSASERLKVLKSSFDGDSIILGAAALARENG